MVHAAGFGSHMFLRPALTSIALAKALEKRWAFIRPLTHNRLGAQISQAEGKVAQEKQKDSVLV